MFTRIVFIILLIIPISSNAYDRYEAIKKFSHAFIKYNKIDKQIGYLEKRYINKKVRKYSKFTAILISAYTNKYISYKWKF